MKPLYSSLAEHVLLSFLNHSHPISLKLISFSLCSSKVSQEVTETSNAAAEEAKQSEEEPEIVTEEDENRTITAAEALKKLDKLKNFIEVNKSDHLNMILNELIENEAQK